MEANESFIYPCIGLDKQGNYQEYRMVFLDAYNYNHNTRKYCNLRLRQLWGKRGKYRFIEDVAESKASKQLQEKLDTTPAKGSSVFVTPMCKVLQDDIRKFYTIKRDITKADFLIVDFGIDSRRIYQADQWCKWEDEKLIIMGNVQDFDTLFDPVSAPGIEGLEKLGIKSLSDNYTRNEGNIPRIVYGPESQYEFIKLLLQTGCSKPCISSKKLSLGCNIQLTLDMVKAFETTCLSTTGTFNERQQKLFTSMAALNQTNWKNYVGTLSRLFTKMYRTPTSVMYRTNVKQYPRSCVSIIEECYDSIKPFASKEDYDMFMQYMVETYNLKEENFMSVFSLTRVLNAVPYNSDEVQKMFDCICRVVPKSYEQYTTINSNYGN